MVPKAVVATTVGFPLQNTSQVQSVVRLDSIRYTMT
jgi:hypothetical protein